MVTPCIIVYSIFVVMQIFCQDTRGVRSSKILCQESKDIYQQVFVIRATGISFISLTFDSILLKVYPWSALINF